MREAPGRTQSEPSPRSRVTERGGEDRYSLTNTIRVQTFVIHGGQLVDHSKKVVFRLRLITLLHKYSMDCKAVTIKLRSFLPVCSSCITEPIQDQYLPFVQI